MRNTLPDVPSATYSLPSGPIVLPVTGLPSPKLARCVTSGPPRSCALAVGATAAAIKPTAAMNRVIRRPTVMVASSGSGFDYAPLYAAGIHSQRSVWSLHLTR